MLTIIKEYDAVNKYRNIYRAIYNNNMLKNNFMIADFNTGYYQGSIVSVTPSFNTIPELINFYNLNFGYPVGKYHGSIMFVPNFVVERF